jgi:hypothetical protein
MRFVSFHLWGCPFVSPETLETNEMKRIPLPGACQTGSGKRSGATTSHDHSHLIPGRPRPVRKDIDEAVLWALVTRSGGEQLPADW